MARYRLKYCLKGPLNPKQPTNQKQPRYENSYCHKKRFIKAYQKQSRFVQFRALNKEYLGRIRDKFSNCFVISAHKICCDPSSEPSRQDGSDDGSQHTFSVRNKKNYPSVIIKYSSYGELCSIYMFKTVRSCCSSKC